jgi:hypothetical protein
MDFGGDLLYTLFLMQKVLYFDRIKIKSYAN